MRRPSGWRKRLETFTDGIRRQPFDWSKQHDCAMGLVAGAAEALLQVDIAAEWRGKYSTELGALRAMRARGYANIGDAVADILPEIHPSQAMEGDIAAVADGGSFGFALGVVIGDRIFVLRKEGLATVGLLEASRAFKVG